MNTLTLTFDMPPYRLTGTVYGTLLNHRPALTALGDSVDKPPYKAAPKAPILYIKPRNALASANETVHVPDVVKDLEVGAALGIVIGRTACRVEEGQALAYVAGYTIVNDISVPHESFYRPSIRFKARDGFCPIGPRVAGTDEIRDPDRVPVRVFVDDVLVQSTSTADMIRPVAKLIADVTDFMTLAPGDVLMLGVAAGAPRVRAGQRAVIELEGIGRLETSFVGALQ